jgi:hypothetical protein
MPGKKVSEHVNAQLPKEQRRRRLLEENFGDDKKYVLGDTKFRNGENVTMLEMNGWSKLDIKDADKPKYFLPQSVDIYAKDIKQWERDRQQERAQRQTEVMRQPEGAGSGTRVEGKVEKTTTYTVRNDD